MFRTGVIDHDPPPPLAPGRLSLYVARGITADKGTDAHWQTFQAHQRTRVSTAQLPLPTGVSLVTRRLGDTPRGRSRHALHLWCLAVPWLSVEGVARRKHIRPPPRPRLTEPKIYDTVPDVGETLRRWGQGCPSLGRCRVEPHSNYRVGNRSELARPVCEGSTNCEALSNIGPCDTHSPIPRITFMRRPKTMRSGGLGCHARTSLRPFPCIPRCLRRRRRVLCHAMPSRTIKHRAPPALSAPRPEPCCAQDHPVA